MKYILITLLFYTHSSSGQTITKYYDADMIEALPSKAVYYAEFIRQDNGYATTIFWKANGMVKGKAVYEDTVIGKPLGLQLTYHKTGRLEDSLLFENDSYKYVYHFDQSGKLRVKHYTPEGEKEPVTEAWDEDGKKIKKMILFREAEFKGGQSAWEKHLTKKGSKDLDVKGDIPQKATAFVKFVIDEEGNVTNVKIHKPSGLKEVDRDAVQIVSESPPWKPAIKYNEPVKAFRIQPVTYTTAAKK